MYHVTMHDNRGGEKKKLVTMPPGSAYNAPNLKNTVMEQFHLLENQQNFCFQLYSPDFEDWIDLSDDENIPQKCKIQVKYIS